MKISAVPQRTTLSAPFPLYIIILELFKLEYKGKYSCNSPVFHCTYSILLITYIFSERLNIANTVIVY